MCSQLLFSAYHATFSVGRRAHLVARSPDSSRWIPLPQIHSGCPSTLVFASSATKGLLGRSNGSCPLQLRTTSESHPPRYIHSEWWGIPIVNIAVFVTLSSLTFPVLNISAFVCTCQITPETGVAFASFLSTHQQYLKILTLSMFPELSLSIQLYRNFYNVSFPFLHTLVLNHTQFFVKRAKAPHTFLIFKDTFGRPQLP